MAVSGRKPIRLSEAQKAEVETLAAVLSVQQIADYFGIGRTTFFSMMNRDPAIAERYKRGKARAIGAIAQSLINKARSGDMASMIFFLKTQAGWREVSPPELPEEDPPGLTIDVKMLSTATLAELVAARRPLQGRPINGEPGHDKPGHDEPSHDEPSTAGPRLLSQSSAKDRPS